MSLTLPANFKKDIQGRDTNLYPIIAIGNYVSGTGFQDNSIYISTNDVLYSNLRFMPLLLNIPSLKESVDIEKRNYKISAVTLDIANFPYEGMRFSERASQSLGSLINIECRIWWVSPSTTDYSTTKPTSDTNAMNVYQGSIRKYTHDDEKVRLVLEDLSQKMLHIDLPKTNLGSNNINVPEKGINKYVPMVYGDVDRSPLVHHRSISEEVTEGEGEAGDILEYRLKAETEAIIWVADSVNIGAVSHPISPLYFYENDAYHNVHQTANDLGEDLGPKNFRFSDNNTGLIMDVDNVDLGTGGEGLANDFAEGKIRLHAVRRFVSSETITGYSDTEAGGESLTLLNIEKQGLFGHITGEIEVGAIGYADPQTGYQNYGPGDGISRAATWGGLKCYLEPLFVPGNLATEDDGSLEKPTTIILLNISEHWSFVNVQNIPDSSYTPNDAPQWNSVGQQETHWGVWNGSTPIVTWQTDGGHTETGSLISWQGAYNNMDDLDHFNRFHYTNLIRDLRWWDTLTSFDYVNIGIPMHRYNTVNLLTPNQQQNEHIHWGVDTTIDDAFIVQTYRVMGITDKDYYANIIGRRGGGNRADEIIADIVIEEIGIDQAWSDVYTEPSGLTDPYPNNYWNYSFTVDKKINSKKLIEGLASVSPFIPRFDHMGNFKFNIIYPKYEEIDPFIEIKADDITSSSFSRTSINDVYTRVELKYKWDYGREKFSKSTIWQIESESDDLLQVNVDTYFGNIPYEYDYYGLKTDESESTLVIDDDRGKYIRYDTTAENFAKWILRFYANQHLKIKIRMHIKYMYVEIGDILRFDKIIDVKPYGIDYSKDAEFLENDTYPHYGSLVNGQQVFPDFMCISTNKTLEYCEIECIQMHNLSDEPRISKQISGCMDDRAWNHNSDAEVQPSGDI